MSRANEAKTVLVVDDAPENIDILRNILQPYFAVRVANSGRTALRAVHVGELPDLILLDVMMPGMDGYEVCSRLKTEERTRHIPVIFVTTRAEVRDEAHGFEIGAADYITKPVSPPVVLARVRTHINLHDRARHFEELVEKRTASLLARTQELARTRVEIVRCLGRACEYRDNETGLHVVRLGRYVQLLGRALGMSVAESERLMQASMLHDIGKIGIPDHILLKPGKLTPEEFAVIRRHCQMGADIIGAYESPLLRLARQIALSHHEKWNGKGYPQGLRGEEIPLAGRITALADAFDALTSVRPYKRAWTVAEATAWIVAEKGESFDPELVQLFLSLGEEIEAVRLGLQDAGLSEYGAHPVI